MLITYLLPACITPWTGFSDSQAPAPTTTKSRELRITCKAPGAISQLTVGQGISALKELAYCKLWHILASSCLWSSDAALCQAV